MKKTRPYVLSIAGFDPSAGAGVLADIKTFEQCGVYGLGVVSAQTVQTHDVFEKILAENILLAEQQIKLLAKTYQPSFVKIGLVPDIQWFIKIIDVLHQELKGVKIIWDPVLKSSTGFVFHQNIQDLHSILSRLYLITPNWDEAQILSNNSDVKKGAQELSKYTHVFLKGGHQVEDLGKDFLYTKEGKTHPFRPKNKKPIVVKHGSGCVFSSALTAYLSQGYPLVKSCLYAKEYTLRVLESNVSALGYHKR